MKLKIRNILVLSIIFVNTFLLYSQSTGDYRSRISGEWRNNTTWEIFSAGAWRPASEPPTGTSGVITILSTHIVTVGAVANDSVTINGATVIVDGYLREVGYIKKEAGEWIINGTYEYAHPTSSSTVKVGLPTATWNTGSTCIFTGITSYTTNLNAVQNFHNIVWDCPQQQGNLNLGWNRGIITVSGNITIISTGVGRLQLCAPLVDSSVTVNILGDIFVDGRNTTPTNLISFTSNGTSNNPTYVTVNTYGDIKVYGHPDSSSYTNFSVSRGSGPNVTWNLFGNFIMINSKTQNSGPNKSKFVFSKQGKQTLQFSNVDCNTNFEILGNSFLDIDTSVIRGQGSFRVLPGATLESKHHAGIDTTNIRCSGSNGGGNLFSETANYIFSGSSPQISGTLLPSTVNNLTIDNPGGVFLSNFTTVNGYLYLTAGILDNCTNTLTVSADRIVYGLGSLACPLTSVDDESTNLPSELKLYSNYPNPFNPLTQIKFSLPRESYVTLKVFDLLGNEVASIYEGFKLAGTYTITFDGSKLSSGIYYYRIQTGNALQSQKMILMK